MGRYFKAYSEKTWEVVLKPGDYEMTIAEIRLIFGKKVVFIVGDVVAENNELQRTSIAVFTRSTAGRTLHNFISKHEDLFNEEPLNNIVSMKPVTGLVNAVISVGESAMGQPFVSGFHKIEFLEFDKEKSNSVHPPTSKAEPKGPPETPEDDTSILDLYTDEQLPF